MSPVRQFYVYVLWDPRDGKVFYVGKGKGRRIAAHEVEARGLTTTNPRKTARIRAIWAAGLEVLSLKVCDGLLEAEAFALEREVIEGFGREQLTNHMSGVVTGIERAKLLLARVKPFAVWVAEQPRSDVERELYRQVVRELGLVASGLRHPGGVWATAS